MPHATIRGMIRRMPDPRETFEAIIKEQRPEAGPIEQKSHTIRYV